MRTDSKEKKILHVSLMVEGKPCLVVGGGLIAARKVAHLLEAGAKVTVVSPDLCPEIALLKKSRRIRHKPRVFEQADIKRQFLVFATTDQGPVNLRVIKACRRSRVLCGAADAHWDEGDFLTPAIIRRPTLTVAITTGGRSCSLSRSVKEKVSQFLVAEKL